MTREKEYFTPAEFAKLFHIDRQTLIYYDNNGIFSPDFKNSNGYRYYSIDRAFMFFELQALKTLDVTGAQLSAYHQKSTGEALLGILDEKIKEYEMQVEQLSLKIKNLKGTKQRIHEREHFPVDQIMLIPRSGFYYVQGDSLPRTISYLQALKKNMELVTQYANGLFTYSTELSMMPSYEILGELAGSYSYRVIISSSHAEAFAQPSYFPPGLYLTMVTKGRFRQTPQKYIDQIQDFMKKLHLKDEHLMLVTPFRNMSKENVEESFYVKIELKVSYE